MKYKAQTISVGCIAALLFVISPTASAIGRKQGPSPGASPAAKTTASPSASAAAKGPRAIPFHGMISAVDKKAKTFTIAGNPEGWRNIHHAERHAVVVRAAACGDKRVENDSGRVGDAGGIEDRTGIALPGNERGRVNISTQQQHWCWTSAEQLEAAR